MPGGPAETGGRMRRPVAGPSAADASRAAPGGGPPAGKGPPPVFAPARSNREAIWDAVSRAWAEVEVVVAGAAETSGKWRRPGREKERV